MAHDQPLNRTSDAKDLRTLLPIQIAWILCALMWAVLLMQGAAEIGINAAVPIIALNFIGLVIWFQLHSR